MRERRRPAGMVTLVALGAAWLATAAWAGDGDAVAIVNGHPISKRRMVDVLMDSHGLQIMQQLIVLELAKSETQRLELRVSAADVDREFEQALTNIAPEVSATGEALSEVEKEQVLDRLLQDKGLSRAEFMIGMERNAHLRKIVEKSFHVDDATLREEFARVHGEKVEVRAIQVGDINGLHEALNLLEKEVDFAEVARRVSQDTESARRGGLLAPFTFKDPDVAPVLREAVFALKDGERTKPIKVGRWWFIVKLERRIPPADVQFDEVRDQVERQMRARVIPEEMNRLVVKLFQQADIRILDRKLKPRFEELLKENRLTGPSMGP